MEEQGQSSDQVVPAQAPAPPSNPWAYVRLEVIIPEQTGHSMVYINTATGEMRGGVHEAGYNSDGRRTSAAGR